MTASGWVLVLELASWKNKRTKARLTRTYAIQDSGLCDGSIAMLTAYFDDSGTHAKSKIVMVAGISGTEGRLAGLEHNWRKHLERPLEGTKRRLKRFHMVDCQGGRGEYEGWSRPEIDHFCYQLQTEIIDSGVVAYGIACSRSDWDDLVTGDIRAIFGDAEGMCIRNNFVRILGWAQSNTFDPEMKFVFDNRPANDILIEGFAEPKRPQFRRLLANMQCHGQIATRDSIKKVVDHAQQQDKKMMKAAANHFTVFDPDAPETFASSFAGNE
jgi:hypothetical protein